MKKEKLAEQLIGVFCSYGYSPIAGKIATLMYISEQKHFTFDELMSKLDISKSATSKALNFLQEIGEVNYTIKDDNKRKRYFYICPEGNLKQFEKILKSMHLQVNIYNEILEIRGDKNKELNKFIEQQMAYLQDILPQMENKYKEYFKQYNQKLEI